MKETETVGLLQTLKDVGLRFGEDFSCKKVYIKFKRENEFK